MIKVDRRAQRLQVVARCCSRHALGAPAANSTLLIHRAEVGPEKLKRSDRWTAARWNSFVAWLERHDREMVDRYHERTGAPRAWLECEIRNENHMTASEALRRGFLTRVNEKLEAFLQQ